MSTFSVETAVRWDALELRRRLFAFSPWMVELERGSWLVHGSLGASSIEDVRPLVDAGAREHGIDPLPVLHENLSAAKPIDS